MRGSVGRVEGEELICRVDRDVFFSFRNQFNALRAVYLDVVFHAPPSRSTHTAVSALSRFSSTKRSAIWGISFLGKLHYVDRAASFSAGANFIFKQFHGLFSCLLKHFGQLF